MSGEGRPRSLRSGVGGPAPASPSQVGDADLSTRVLERAGQALWPIEKAREIGHAECLTGLTGRVRQLRPNVHARVDGPGAQARG